MGHIKQQSLKGSIYSYLGVLLGFAISGLLLPKLLTPSENGLIKLLIAYSTLLAQFGTLGFTNATGRLFAFFRNPARQHHGFFLLNILVLLAGFGLTTALFYLFKDTIISYNLENSELFIDYLEFLIPLTFFTLLFLMLDSYLKMLFQSVVGTFYREFFQRVIILGAIALFYFDLVSFRQFIMLYVLANCLPAIFLLIKVVSIKEFSLKSDWNFIDKRMARELVSMSFYGIVIGFSSIVVINVDSIILSRMVGIEATGIYAITFFFGTLVIIPARSLRKIAGTVLADAWRDNNLGVIDDIYRKSCISQMIIGMLIFIGLWGNIDNVFRILPPEYAAGKYIILFIGLTNLIEMTSGVSNIILNTSAYYRLTGYLNLALVVMVVIFNIIFIQIFGLIGVAIASTVSYSIFNLLRYYFIYSKFKMHPFSIKQLWVIGLGLLAYLVSLALPAFSSLILDIFVRSTLITLVFGIGVYVLKLSEDVNKLVDEGFHYFLFRWIKR